MTRLLRPIGGLAAVIVVAMFVAACGSSSATASPSAAALANTPPPATAPPEAATPEATVSETPAASEEATPTLDLSSLLPSFTADTELEKVLPDTVGSETLQKFSFRGTDMPSTGQDTQEFQNALGQLGKSLSDLSFAVAASENVTIGAYKLAGAPSATFMSALLTALRAGAADATVTDANVGGKPVKKIESTSGAVYLYGHDDIVFFVQSDDDALLAQALAALP
jgi:hypothetical protein